MVEEKIMAIKSTKMEFQVSACWPKGVGIGATARLVPIPETKWPEGVSCCVADTCAAIPESGQLSVRQAPL